MTDSIYQAKDAVPIQLLHEAFGEYITLTDDSEDHICRLLSEFHIAGSDYAVLQPEDADEDEYVLYRIVKTDEGELELESIDDDEEWEAVAEVYDEMTFEP